MTNEAAAWMVAAVKADSGLAALEGRIFPDAAPEGTGNPCLVYQLIGDEGEAVVDAGPLDRGTLAFQVRIYGKSRSAANGLREAFRQRFQGLEPQDIGGGWRIEGSAFGELADTYEAELKDYGALGVLEIHLIDY
jgi:hypothetical protein